MVYSSAAANRVGRRPILSARKPPRGAPSAMARVTPPISCFTSMASVGLWARSRAMLGRTELIAVRHKAERIPLSRTTSLPVKSSLPSGAAASMLAIPFSPRPRRGTAWYPYADRLGSCRTGGVRRSISVSVLPALHRLDQRQGFFGVLVRPDLVFGRGEGGGDLVVWGDHEGGALDADLVVEDDAAAVLEGRLIRIADHNVQIERLADGTFR